jgi:homoserine kinase type II
MAADPMVDLDAVLAHYDLGRLVKHVPDRRGTVNISFEVEVLRRGRRHTYFLRKYRPGIGKEEIRFEHELIEHVARQGTCPIAQVHRTRQGASFLEVPGDGLQGTPGYYAVFDFLPGEDRYTWVGPRCTPVELHNAGDLLARFHAAVGTFKPTGRRVEPKIAALVGVIADMWAAAPSLSKGTVFDAFVAEHFDEVRQDVRSTVARLRDARVLRLPEVVTHSDYHPGNLKFEGDRISGLVDFDWAKVDLRAFDVGLAVWYFCASWEGGSDGSMRLEDVRAFVAAYQERLRVLHALPPLSPEEMQLLPDLIQAGNIYILYWTIRDYFGKDVDPAEYLVYLKHSLQTSRWLRSLTNRAELSRVLGELTEDG